MEFDFTDVVIIRKAYVYYDHDVLFSIWVLWTNFFVLFVSSCMVVNTFRDEVIVEMGN